MLKIIKQQKIVLHLQSWENRGRCSTPAPLPPVPLATTDKSRPTKKRLLFSNNSLTLHYSTKQEKLKEHMQPFYCQWSAWKKKAKQNKTNNHCFWWKNKFCHPIFIKKKKKKKVSGESRGRWPSPHGRAQPVISSIRSMLLC